MWGLVAHTVAMFSCTTISVVLEFSEPGPFGIYEPGVHLGYRVGGVWGHWSLMLPNLGLVIAGLMFPLSQWLADGLLVIMF